MWQNYLSLDFLRSRDDLEFTGYDIVSSSIESHKSQFSQEAWIFHQHDIVSDQLETRYDLILSRSTMMHLTDVSNLRALRNMRKSGSRYLLMTTHSNVENTDLVAESWRRINFFKTPYNMPTPLCLAKDSYLESLYIVLYDLQALSEY